MGMKGLRLDHARLQLRQLVALVTEWDAKIVCVVICTGCSDTL